jgi:hypothetical protein
VQMHTFLTTLYKPTRSNIHVSTQVLGDLATVQDLEAYIQSRRCWGTW